MKLRFKQNNEDNSIWVELESGGKVLSFSKADINSFIQNREVNDLIFTSDMTKDEKINIKLMLVNVITEILRDV